MIKWVMTEEHATQDLIVWVCCFIETKRIGDGHPSHNENPHGYGHPMGMYIYIYISQVSNGYK